MKAKIALCCIILFFAGCVKTIDETGQAKYSLDPNEVAKYETVTETSLTILQILSAFIPALLPIAGVGVGIFGAWAKLKPKLTEAQTSAKLAHTITDSTVLAIEDFKAANPEKWAEIEAKYFTGVIGLEAENVIRAIRGMPAKTS